MSHESVKFAYNAVRLQGRNSDHVPRAGTPVYLAPETLSNKSGSVNEPVDVYFVTVASGVAAEEVPATRNVPDGPSAKSAPDPESVSVPDVPNEESSEPVEEIFAIFVVDVEPEDPTYMTSTESPTEIIFPGETKPGDDAESRVRIPFVPNEVSRTPFDENFMTTAATA